MSQIDMALITAYLANIDMAVKSENCEHAEVLLKQLHQIMNPSLLPSSSSMELQVGVGLDTGYKRKGRANEDLVFATKGTNEKTGEIYGLFIVADGMGGHADGQDASRLAVEALVGTMVPYLQYKMVISSDLGSVLEHAVKHANGCIYDRNINAKDPMGTTVTVAVTFGPHAFIANVGDSRTYIYRPGVGLRKVTRDHSYVASLVESGQIPADDIYIHPKRNQIYRSLGAQSVDVDIFHEILQNGDVLLLCSDGLWEMTRDDKIQQVLGSSIESADMVEHLVNLALKGGGEDNIGCVVSKCHMEVAEMHTVLMTIPAGNFVF